MHASLYTFTYKYWKPKSKTKRKTIFNKKTHEEPEMLIVNGKSKNRNKKKLG